MSAYSAAWERWKPAPIVVNILYVKQPKKNVRSLYIDKIKKGVLKMAKKPKEMDDTEATKFCDFPRPVSVSKTSKVKNPATAQIATLTVLM
jgi:hypothetical protein